MLMVRDERVKYHLDYNAKNGDSGIFIDGNASVDADLFEASVMLSMPLEEDSEWFYSRLDKAFNTRFELFESEINTDEDENGQDRLIYTFAAYTHEYSLGRLMEIIEVVADATESYIDYDNCQWVKEH